MTTYPSFSDYKHVIAGNKFAAGDPLPTALEVWRGESGKHTVFYAPVEHRNPAPKIALIGITPGRTQGIKALHAAHTALSRGLSDEQCLIVAKLHAAFGGDMRDDLVSMLDLLGVQRLIGETTTENLWTPGGYPKAHFSSLLSFPTFGGEKDYNDSPRVTSSDAFREMLEATANDLNTLPADTLVLPLGAQVTEALVALRKLRLLTRELVAVDGMPIYVPHPSGQNVESIDLLLDWKYDRASEYAEVRHAKYVVDKPWLKKPGRKEQAPEEYKATRVTRWQAVHRLRKYFGLS